MTDTTPPDDPADDQPAQQPDDQPLEAVPAAVHRRLGDAGVRLNEAQTHLSAVRTQATRADLSGEVARAEAQALTRALEESRTRIDEALALAERLATAEGDDAVGDESDEQAQTSEDAPEATDDEDRDDGGPSMLWNTVYPEHPNGAR